MSSIWTFYSYKGGSGRTFALANIAVALGSWGYRVLCIDWDLEAPGLHLYFKPLMRSRTDAGLVDWVVAASRDGQDWRSFVVPLDLPTGRNVVSVIPAGEPGPVYYEKLRLVNWATLYETDRLGSRLEDARAEWLDEFDVVLLDSRTGVSDIGGICTAQLPDFVVAFITPNEQSLAGTVDVLQSAEQERRRLPVDRQETLVVPVASRIESTVEFDLTKVWMSKIEVRMRPFVERWAPTDVEPADLLTHLRIPSVPRWSFGEHLPVLSESSDDSLSVTHAFETVAAAIAQGLQAMPLLVRSRDAYVDAARAGPSSVSFAADVLIVAAKDGADFAEALSLELRGRGIPSATGILGRDLPTSKYSDQMLQRARDFVLILSGSVSSAQEYEYRALLTRALADETPRVVVPVALRTGPVTARSLGGIAPVVVGNLSPARVADEVEGRLGFSASEKASPGEPSEALRVWMQTCVERFETLTADEGMRDRYQYGSWKCAYRVLPPFAKPSLSRFAGLLREAVGRETGWPVWWWPPAPETPYPTSGVIECLMGRTSGFNDPSHSDFWRASPNGFMFLLRGYEDDDRPADRTPGTLLDLGIPLWRTGECLSHSARLASVLARPENRVEFVMQWDGLLGRRLATWARPRIPLHTTGVATDASVSSSVIVPASQIDSNLVDLVEELTEPLYATFGFAVVPRDVIANEIARLRDPV